MGKGNLIFASRRFILQKVTSTCNGRVHGGLTCTTLPTIDAKVLARGLHEHSGGRSSLTEELEDILDPQDQGWESSTNSMTCIYSVPSTMRQVNRKAFDPSIVSIGPYHHGVESLQEMEKLKHTYFRRLFQPSYHDQVDAEVVLQKKKALDAAKKAMEEMEVDARSCYSEQSKLSSREFVKMMLIDGCFIIGLLRDSLLQPDFEHTPSIIQRWMLPTLRRDLIKLENQLPLSVLRKLFQLTQASTASHEKSIAGWELVQLEALALRFFKPLLRGHDDVLTRSQEHYAPKHCQLSSSKHFLDLFHNRISPDCSTGPVQELRRGMQTKQIPSIQELLEAGVKFKTDPSRRALEITFGRSLGRGKVLTIPRIHIADHKGTLFRNMVAFEKCYPNCHQNVTSYLFFLDSLINSAKDVGLLHYHKVLHHSLGSNREVAKLVNNLCKEVTPDVSKSYLYKVVEDINEYYSSSYGRVRGFLVHHHFSNWLVGISTLAACVALYLAFVQTGCTVATSREKLHEHTRFRDFVKESLLYHHISRWVSFGKFQDLLEKFKDSLLSHCMSRCGSFGTVPRSLREHFEALVSKTTENKAVDRGDTKNCQQTMVSGSTERMQYCVYHLT